VVDGLEGVVQFAGDTHLGVSASRSRFHNRLGIGEVQIAITWKSSGIGRLTSNTTTTATTTTKRKKSSTEVEKRE
jgi:hypothetical protein